MVADEVNPGVTTVLDFWVTPLLIPDAKGGSSLNTVKGICDAYLSGTDPEF